MNRLTHSLSTFWSTALIALFVVACGGKQVDTTIPIDAARILNSELSATYVRTRTLLEETTQRVRTVGEFPADIRADDIDADLMRHVLEACFTQNITMAPGVDIDELPRGAQAEVGPANAPLTARPTVGRVLACTPSRMLALESYLDAVGAREREFIVDRVLTVDILRANLKDVLTAQIDDVERTTVSAATELQQLRETASERRALAQTADLTPEERRRTEVDYETITQELDQVEDVLGVVTTELVDWRRLRRQLVDEAARNIAEMGTPR